MANYLTHQSTSALIARYNHACTGKINLAQFVHVSQFDDNIILSCN